MFALRLPANVVVSPAEVFVLVDEITGEVVFKRAPA
jgi:hypothetical protein